MTCKDYFDFMLFNFSYQNLKHPFNIYQKNVQIFISLILNNFFQIFMLVSKINVRLVLKRVTYKDEKHKKMRDN